MCLFPSVAASVHAAATMSGSVASDFFRAKYEREARKNWDIFYKNNRDNFFKDRHWLAREWPEVFPVAVRGLGEDANETPDDDGNGVVEDVRDGPGSTYEVDASKPRVFLELGCGVGNTVFPLLELDSEATVYCCDFSARAVDLVKERASKLPERDRDRVKAFVCDGTCESLLDNVPMGSVDVCTMIFALSAMSREKMSFCVRNVATVMRGGKKGVVCVRDYAAGDLAQERLNGKDSQKISDNFYVRGDGTRAYYFSPDDLTELFAAEGMEMRRLHVQSRTITNRAKSVDMNRRWIQASFASRDEPLTEFVPPPPEANPHIAAWRAAA